MEYTLLKEDKEVAYQVDPNESENHSHSHLASFLIDGNGHYESFQLINLTFVCDGVPDHVAWIRYQQH